MTRSTLDRVGPLLTVLAALAITTAQAGAQTISPLVTEHGTKANGRVELRNDADWPLDVVMEPRGFTVDETGELQDRPLAPGVRVTLSAMSLRIPPKQTRYVFYEASSEVLPAWFVLYASFRGFPKQEFKGAAIQLELPSVVYLLPKRAMQADEVSARIVSFEPAARRVVLEVANGGEQFARVVTSEVTGGASIKGGSFPLLPHGVRRLELPWEGVTAPDAIMLKTRTAAIRKTLSPADR